MREGGSQTSPGMRGSIRPLKVFLIIGPAGGPGVFKRAGYIVPMEDEERMKGLRDRMLFMQKHIEALSAELAPLIEEEKRQNSGEKADPGENGKGEA